MVDHVREPIFARWFACCRSARWQQDGGNGPLTLHEGHACRVRVEAADVLGVEQSNGPGGISLVAPVRPLDTDGSDTFAGDFVKYAVLIGRAHPFKYEAHLDFSLLFPTGSPVRRDFMLRPVQGDVPATQPRIGRLRAVMS